MLQDWHGCCTWNLPCFWTYVTSVVQAELRCNESPRVMAKASLEALLARRRSACAEFESQPAATTADAGASGCSVASAKDQTHHLRDLQLGELLAERRNLCEVLESCPLQGSADVAWNKEVKKEKQKLWLESCPAKQIADVKCEDPLETRHANLPGRLAQRASSSGAMDSKVIPAPMTPAKAVANYLQQLPGAGDAVGSIGSEFVEKHLAYLNFEENHLLAILGIFLRYHDPCRLSELGLQSGVLNSVDWITQNVGPPPSPLRFLLGRLEEPTSGPEAREKAREMANCVSQLCSFLLEVENSLEAEVQMFFVLLAALKLPPAQPANSAVALWQEATEMLRATPRSTWSLLCDPSSDAWSHSICCVAPDEVLQHIYERPAVDWRLVVLDLRSASSAVGLPVCVRLPLTSLEQLDLSLLPRDPAIHLCLVGDDLSQTEELCRHLCGMGMGHISMADGGWEQLEQLVMALGLELLPPLTPSPSQPLPEVPVLPVSSWMDALKVPSWALGWAESSGKEEELMDI